MYITRLGKMDESGKGRLRNSSTTGRMTPAHTHAPRKKVHVLFQEICKCTALHGKKATKDTLKDLTTER